MDSSGLTILIGVTRPAFARLAYNLSDGLRTIFFYRMTH